MRNLLILFRQAADLRHLLGRYYAWYLINAETSDSPRTAADEVLCKKSSKSLSHMGVDVQVSD